MTLKDQLFRLFFYNRRKIIEPEWIETMGYNDHGNILLDSNSMKNINQCKTFRFLSNFPITISFNKNNENRAVTYYKTNIELGVRNFIKAYYSKNESFGLRRDEFKYVKDLISLNEDEKWRW